jgi:hypothetical protein
MLFLVFFLGGGGVSNGFLFFLYICQNVCPELYRGVLIRGTAEFRSHLFSKMAHGRKIFFVQCKIVVKSLLSYVI